MHNTDNFHKDNSLAGILQRKCFITHYVIDVLSFNGFIAFYLLIYLLFELHIHTVFIASVHLVPLVPFFFVFFHTLKWFIALFQMLRKSLSLLTQHVVDWLLNWISCTPVDSMWSIYRLKITSHKVCQWICCNLEGTQTARWVREWRIIWEQWFSILKYTEYVSVYP